MWNLRRVPIHLSTEIEKKAKEMMRVSTRINLDLMREYLKINRKIFNHKVKEWANEFGFIEEGGYLIKLEHPDEEEKKRTERLKEEKILEKFKEMTSVSSKINLEMMRSALQMNKDKFNSKIFRWAKEYGFIIDNDMLIIKQETVSDFIDELDKKFKAWGKIEVEKYEKI